MGLRLHHRLPPWPAAVNLLAVAAVATAAAFGIIHFQDGAARAHQARFEVGLVKAHAFEARYLHEEGFVRGGVTAGFTDEVLGALDDGEAGLDRLAGVQRHGHEDGVTGAFAAVRRSLEQELAALNTGDTGTALRIEDERTEPAFVRLLDAVDEELGHYAEEAEAADTAADAVTIAALGLAALLISGLGALQRRARATAERAAVEQAALAESERRFRALIHHSSDLIVVVGRDLTPHYCAPSIERVLGYPAREADEAVDRWVHPDDAGAVRSRLLELASEPGRAARLQFRVRHRNGSWRHFETVATNLLHEPTVAGLVLNGRDVTDRTDLERQLTHRALHDPLTDLANRALFQDRVEHALAQAARQGSHTAVALLDLDGFKAVNDSLGHAEGDRLLVDLARRLRACVRPGDTVARLGGDEFAVLMESTVAVEALAVADRVHETLRQPVVLAGRPVVVRASIGLAGDREATDADALLRNADLAMYAAKAAGKGRSEVYHHGMHESVQARLELEADLRAALEDAVSSGQLFLSYQPKVSLATGRLTGVEALLRWRHPGRGLVSPAEFIPLAEDTGLIVPIGAWVLGEACRQSAAWQSEAPGAPPLAMSVNVSGRQFGPGLVDDVARALAASGIDPATLCLEVTESVVMDDLDAAVTTLEALKALGVRLSIDDFGTGYSSLGYLRQFPLDELKIDKTFVDGLGRGPEADAIVSAIMGMAGALELSVVAEGVETEDQARRLQALDCDAAQGFYFAPPRPAGDIAGLLGGQAVAAGAGPLPARERPAVLVVDDAQAIRDLVRLSLERAGFEVHTAGSGEEALPLAIALRPACVLVDVVMPGMGGLEVLEALRRDPATAASAVVMLTSAAQASYRARAAAAGADDYIVKPFLPLELVGRVQGAISRRAGSPAGSPAR